MDGSFEYDDVVLPPVTGQPAAIDCEKTQGLGFIFFMVWDDEDVVFPRFIQESVSAGAFVPLDVSSRRSRPFVTTEWQFSSAVTDQRFQVSRQQGRLSDSFALSPRSNFSFVRPYFALLNRERIDGEIVTLVVNYKGKRIYESKFRLENCKERKPLFKWPFKKNAA